jgi:hypothetical protein
MSNDLITCHNCDTQGIPETLTELGPNVYECERCWKTTGGSPLSTCAKCLEDYDTEQLNAAMTCESCVEVSDTAYNLVMNDMTDANAHTLAALVDHFYNGMGDTDLMAKAYDAARQVLAAKND